MSKQEVTDIIQNFYSKLKEKEIDLALTKQDVSTSKTKPLRGDLWISTSLNSSASWERNIIALVEAKSKHSKLDDRDWIIAKKDGQKKAKKQGLPYFIVTNTIDLIRFYNTESLDFISIDGVELSTIQRIEVLQKIFAQVNKDNSNVIHKINLPIGDFTEKDFQKTLFSLKNIYRMSQIDNDSEMINTTIGFVVLKYISEREKLQRTLGKHVLLWDDFNENQIHREITFSIEDITKSDIYSDFKEALYINASLTAKQCQSIKNEMSAYTFHGCGFDIYGAIYEAYADKKTKKEFGQYYTRRHITHAIAEILFRNENKPRKMKICDPACGTGGFLTESYKILEKNYLTTNTYTKDVEKSLKNDIISGYDIKPKNVALAKLNMFLAGDGHVNIKVTNDSLISLEKDRYNYILTNPPYGVYKGNAEIDSFTYCNINRPEFLFVEKIIDALVEGGEAAIVLPDGVLETPTRSDFRQKLLQHADILSIISLHEFVFRPYTTEKTYVLFIQKKQKDEVGRIQKKPIWLYLLENDGFQKGDKRYEINENDLPDLVANYMRSIAKGQNKFVEMCDINEDNFFNLMVEYHIPQGDSKVIELDIEAFKLKLKNLNNYEEKLRIIFNED